jgi:hypothetical protein
MYWDAGTAQPIPMPRTSRRLWAEILCSARGEDRLSLNDMMTPSHDFGEYRGVKFLTTDVALVIAVGGACRKLFMGLFPRRARV